MRFRFRGTEYATAERWSFTESSFIENAFKCDLFELFSTQRMLADIYVAMKRSESGGIPWNELVLTSPDDFEILDDEPEMAPPPVELPPEDQWPLDPTDDGTGTDHPPVSVQIYPNPGAPSFPYFGSDGSGSSPADSTGLPSR